MPVENIDQNSISLNYDFSQFIEVVEFVDEEQSFLVDILKNNQKLKGVFFGKAEFIETIRNSLDDTLRQRCEFIKGDLLASILPSGYQVYILKKLLDSLDANQSEDFLKRCFQATETYARFLIVEKSKHPDPENGAGKIKEKYNEIFKKTGFILTNIINSNGLDLVEVLRM